LADQQINGNYGMDQLGSSLEEIQKLVNYRMQHIANSPIGPGSANRYTGQKQQGKPTEDTSGAGEKTVVRSGVVNSGPNKGKKVIEYSDGTREYQ